MRLRISILFVILIFGCMTSFLWWNQAVKSSDPTSKVSITFTVEKSENARSIAERLKKQGFIRSSLAFFLLARFTKLGSNLQAGQFLLNPAMDMDTIAANLTHGTVDVSITIPEGWRNEEIALKFAKELSIPEKEFLSVAREGYMFPDTYFFPKNASSSTVAKIMLDNFKNKTAKFDENKLKQKVLSMDQTVNIASLVEREAKFDQDRPLVASVILNRLHLGMKLDLDATVQYVLGYQPDEKSWWKKELTLDDININSLYNTYKNKGLPPTSIANPGLAALSAVYNAPNTDYLYYVSDKSGKIHFAKDIEGHNINITKYLNK